MAIKAIKDLTPAEAGSGSITYGGITFSQFMRFSLSGVDEYDDAGRMVKWTRYTLIVNDLIYATDETSAASLMKSAEELLNTPGLDLVLTGLDLVLTGLGLGEKLISSRRNRPGVTHYDLDSGPLPQGLQINSIGVLAHEIIWTVTFAVKDFQSQNGPTGSIVAAGHESTWSIDQGLTTRVVQGYVQIAALRSQTGAGIFNHAHMPQYRNAIQVLLPEGFGRVAFQTNLTMDKSRLNYTVVDRQLEGQPLPAGCMQCDADYSVQNTNAGFAQFAATLSASITVAPDRPPILAAEVFMRLYLTKLTALRSKLQPKDSIIPKSIRFSHSIFSRRSAFSVSWIVTACLDDLLRKGGIWDPVGTSWQEWARSMDKAWSITGTAGLSYNANSDALIDTHYTSALPPIRDDGGFRQLSSSSSSVLSLTVTKENSWLAFENRLVADREEEVAVHKPAERYTPPAANESSGDTGKTSLPKITDQPTATLQVRGKPTDRVTMIGFATRIEFEPTVPDLVGFKGKKCTPIKTIVDGPKVIACLLGKKVYQTRWRIDYFVDGGYVSDLPPQKNPLLCCDQQTAAK